MITVVFKGSERKPRFTPEVELAFRKRSKQSHVSSSSFSGRRIEGRGEKKNDKGSP
jgi:hypothetical protein